MLCTLHDKNFLVFSSCWFYFRMRKEEKVPVSLSHEKELKLGKLLLRFPEVMTRYGSSYSGSLRSLPGMEAPTLVPRGHYQVWKLPVPVIYRSLLLLCRKSDLRQKESDHRKRKVSRYLVFIYSSKQCCKSGSGRSFKSGSSKNETEDKLP